MKIKVSDLKTFKANAAFIRQNNIIPILSYLKFEDGTITKNNLSYFLVQTVDRFKESFLVDEKILMNFLDCTSEPEIEITLKDKRILITDGNTKVTSPTDDVSNFPKNEIDDFEKTELDINVLAAINIASNFIVADEPSMPAKCHIFIGKKTVAGSNGFIAYLQQFNFDLPEIILSKDTAQAISKFDVINFSQSERYHFFENHVCKFGIIKPDYKFFDLTVFGVYDKEKPKFEVKKTDMIRFNDMVISSTPKIKPSATFEITDSVMKLKMNDPDYEIDISKEIKVDGEMDGVFTYLPVNLNPLLKNLPDENLTFYQSENKYYITGETGFTSLIMKVVPQD